MTPPIMLAATAAVRRLGHNFRLTKRFFLRQPPEEEDQLVQWVKQSIYRPLLSLAEDALEQIVELRFNHLEWHRAQNRLLPDEELSPLEIVQSVWDEVNINFLRLALVSKSEGRKISQLLRREKELWAIVNSFIEIQPTPGGFEPVLVDLAFDTLVYASLAAFLATPDWAKYVACCPECERIFIRERSDMIYCSKTCRGTKNTRAWRHRPRGMSIALQQEIQSSAFALPLQLQSSSAAVRITLEVAREEFGPERSDQR